MGGGVSSWFICQASLLALLWKITTVLAVSYSDNR